MNLSFLNPSILWALPLAAGPVIIHLFFRRNPRRVEFSDLMFIRKALEKIKTGFRLRRYLLLLVRALIIAFLVLFFSQPVYHPASGAGEEKDKPATIIVLVDLSYSMGYREAGKTRLDEYKAAAKRIVSLAPSRNRIGIIGYSNRIEAATPSLGNDKDYLVSMIDSLAVANRPTDFGAASAALQKLLEQAGDTRVIIVMLSDMAAHGFRGASDPLKNPMQILAFEPRSAGNTFVAGAAASYDESSRQWGIDTRCRESAQKPEGSRLLQLYVQGRKSGSGLLNFTDTVNYKFVYPGEEAEIEGRVELAPDNLSLDDTFYWTARRPSPYKLWIIDGDPKSGGITSESFYLRTAFPDAEVLTEAELDTMELSHPGVVILADVRKDSPALERFINSGGGALIFPGDRYSEDFQPAYMPGSVGMLFNESQSIAWEGLPSEASANGEASAKEGVPQALPVSEFELQKVSIGKGYVLQAAENSSMLARLSSGWPFLLQKNYGEGRVILCAASTDREWGNIATRPVFVPLMNYIARYLSGVSDAGNNDSYNTGGTIKTKYMPGASIITPSGKAILPVRNGGEMLAPLPDEPGIYKLMSGGRAVRSFAVNLDTGSGESDLNVLPLRSLKKYFPGAALTTLPREEWEKVFIASLSGKSLSRHILVIIALLLLAEVLLANPKRQGIGVRV